MPSDIATIAPQKLTGRSRVTNGTKAFARADARTKEARLLRDRERELAVPLGGWDRIAPADRLRVSSAAVLSVRLEQARSALARGEPPASDDDLVRLSRALARELTALDRLAAKLQPKRSAREAVLARHGAAQPGGGS